MSIRVVLRFAFLAAATVMLSGCPGSSNSIVPAMRQLPPDTQVLLAKLGMKAEAPIFVRIFKEESQLEIWKAKDDGRFHLFKTYPICAWSGTLGPKVTHGDKQAPEGFYTVTPGQLNPNSKFYLAFNLGYPNAFDRANGHTGDSLMVHGDCRSAGCFAMTDALIEEIYIIARESLQGGQREFQVHAFPFRMTAENMMRHRSDKWYGFWKTLKEGHDAFEMTRMPPKINVCSRNYLVNANFLGHEATPDPMANCPAYRKQAPDPFDPFNQNGNQQMASANRSHQPAVAPTAAPATAPNTRVAAFAPPTSQAAMAQANRARAAAPQPIPQPVAQQQPVRAAAVSPQAQQPQSAARNTQPTQLMQHQTQPTSAPQPPVLAGATPQRVAPQQKPAETEEPQTTGSDKPAVTQGIHNVVVSGKGDMIVTPRNAPQQ